MTRARVGQDGRTDIEVDASAEAKGFIRPVGLDEAVAGLDDTRLGQHDVPRVVRVEAFKLGKDLVLPSRDDCSSQRRNWVEREGLGREGCSQSQMGSTSELDPTHLAVDQDQAMGHRQLLLELPGESSACVALREAEESVAGQANSA